MSGIFAITGIAAVYLIWYGYQVFVKDKGDLGSLGLTFAVIAFGEVLGALF